MPVQIRGDQGHFRSIVILTAVLLCTPRVCRAESPVLVHVLTSENAINSSIRLVRMRNGKEVSQETIGPRVVYGSTPARLFVFSDDAKDGKRLLRLRSWKLVDGKQEASADVKGEVSVLPLMPRIGAFPGLFLETKTSSVLYCGFKDVLIERQDGNRKVKEKVQEWCAAGISLKSGEYFEVASPGELAIGGTWRSFGDEWGMMQADGRFLLYDSEARSLSDEKYVAAVSGNSFLVPGAGLVTFNKDEQVELLTDSKLEILAAPKVIGEKINGLRRFQRSLSENPVVVEAVRSGDEKFTTVTIRELLSGKQLFLREFALMANDLTTSDDGRVFFVNDKTNKRGILCDGREGREGSAEPIDYARYENAKVFVSLEEKK